MFTIAVCDDNRQYADLLADKLRDLCAHYLNEQIPCRVEHSFYSAEEVLSYLTNHSIQVLFLDIDMPRKSGFELATELSVRSPETVILFVSAYDRLVYSSFEYSPFRFLRKTHLSEELEPAFLKVIEKCLYERETLSFLTTEGEITLRISDIVSIESDKNYILLHTRGTAYRCRGTIADAEKKTEPYDFVRISSAVIVHLSQIDTANNDGEVRLKNGTTVYASRRRLPAFREAYLKYTRRRFVR